MSVWTDSGGFAVTKATERQHCMSIEVKVSATHMWCALALTFCSEVFRPGHVIHSLEGLSLLPGESLLIIILARPAEPVEKNATRASASGSPKYEDDQCDEDYGAEGGSQANDDAGKGRRGR